MIIFETYFIVYNENSHCTFAPEFLTVIGGWSLEPQHLLIAVTRLFYPFFMGPLLSRMFTGADGPRTTGDGYYESSILGPEGIQIEVTE